MSRFKISQIHHVGHHSQCDQIQIIICVINIEEFVHVRTELIYHSNSRQRLGGIITKLIVNNHSIFGNHICFMVVNYQHIHPFGLQLKMLLIVIRTRVWCDNQFHIIRDGFQKNSMLFPRMDTIVHVRLHKAGEKTI